MRKIVDLLTSYKIYLFLLFIYRAANGILFSFGSVLMWAFLKNVLPKNNGLATVAGLTSGFALVKLSTDYLTIIDSQISEVD